MNNSPLERNKLSIRMNQDRYYKLKYEIVCTCERCARLTSILEKYYPEHKKELNEIWMELVHK